MRSLGTRRAAGATGALLLCISLFTLLGLPAMAIEGNCTEQDGGWDEGVTSGAWGTITNNNDGSVSVNLNVGYSLELCVKGGNGYETYNVTGAGLNGPYWPPADCGQNNNQCGLSHWAVRNVSLTTPTTEDTTPTTEDTTPTTEDTTPTTEETTPTTEDTTPTTEETTSTTEDDSEVGGIVVTNPSNPQVTPTTAAAGTTASTLPFTGMSTGSVAVIGAALAALGTLLLVASRRSEDKVAARSWS